MGLTIHYSLKSTARRPATVRRSLERLRQRALDLPFAQVGELVEFTGTDCDYRRRGQDAPHRWLLIQAGQYVTRKSRDGRTFYSHVLPSHVLAFETLPGAGSESANFGLCRYPAYIEVSDAECDDLRRARSHCQRRLRTGLAGWRWTSFCKTQYASNPEAGGVANFLKCHLVVVRLLDAAKSLGFLEGVSDEGGYWESRDAKALAEEVGTWNQLIAAFAGDLQQRLGEQVESSIAEFPNFAELAGQGRSGG